MSQSLVTPGMWDLPRSGTEPMSPALEGRFFTTDSPEKPLVGFLQEVFAWGLPSPFTVLAISVFCFVFFVVDSSLSEFSSQLSDNSLTVCL